MDHFLPNPKQKIEKKNSKKIQKTIKHHQGVSSSQNRLERSRKRENKNFHSDQFLPDPKQKIPKKQQKNSKNLKTLLQLLLKPKQVGKGQEREKRKIIIPINSNPTRNREFEKLKNTIGASFQAKIGRERLRKGEN